jgi:hypothetical protein
VPLTRDYQYAAAQFNAYATATEQSGDAATWASGVSYVNYAGGVEDVLAMCLTGFPSSDQEPAQRRSLIYVGPGSLRAPGDTRPTIFTPDAVRGLTEDAAVQLNVLFTDTGNGALDAVARESGGRSYSGNSNTVASLTEIRDRPPPPTAAEGAAVRATETPDVPLVLALAALAGLVLWPLVVRR